MARLQPRRFEECEFKSPKPLMLFFLNASNFVFKFYFLAQGENDQSSDFITLNWVKFTPLAISTACEGHGKDTFINFSGPY